MTFPQPPTPTETNIEVHFQVSSRHLKNIFNYFKNIFNERFSESTPSPDDGKYHGTVQDFHPKAPERVMNIIHVQTRRLPNKIDQELLVHVAVAIDYYVMKHVIAFQTEIWAKAVARKKFPDT